MRQVLITGGTSGIGRAIAAAFAQDGCHVLVTGRTETEARAMADETGIKATTLDVAQPKEIASLFRTIDRLDVLVNAAGTIERQREHELEAFEQVINVNLTGTMRVCTAAKDLLKASRGCVINLASMLSFFGSGAAPAYSASKGGIAQLTKSLAIAWAGAGIRVNAIAPGWIETALTAPLTADQARRDAIIARTPLARWGQPDDVAGTALFLASPAAAFITGVVLPVDGGYSIA
jgi:NAD(P)-dependent dehydrogenase (short-subunit alcohol dehydrogenase family)